MNDFPRCILGVAVAAVLAIPTVSIAQSADATLRGSAPPNAEVTARNVATGITRRARANQAGNYTIANLAPGTWRVDAGPGTEATVTLTVASTATLDLVATSTAAEVEAPMQEVVVQARRLAEVRTSEVGQTVSADQIANVPQLTRNFLEFADTVPGVVFEVDGAGRTSIRSGGGSENGVNVYIDGVGQKGYVRSGVAGQAGDTQGNPFPQLAIGEYKVITSNYKAEYDQISSAAITALTRSGTNEFEVEAFGTYTADNFRARTPGERDRGTKTESESKEYGLAIGGPILQDRLHFFVTYEAKRFTTPVTVLAGGGAPQDIIAALPADAAAQLGPETIGFEEDLFFGKIDWQITDRDHLDFTAKIRDETGQGDQTGTGVAASASVDTDNTDQRFETSWTHNADRWSNELQFTYEDTFFEPHVRGGDGNGVIYTWNDDNGNDQNILSVNGSDPRAGQNKGQKGWAVANTITFTDIPWLGDHTIKAGIKYKDIELTAQDAVVNNPVFSYDVTPAGAAETPWRAVFGLPLAGFDPIVTSDAKQLGLFIQDDWTVNEHLTLNLGIRWDYEKNPSFEDFVTPQFLIDALNTEDPDTGLTYFERVAQSDDPNTAYDLDDYLSTGNNRKAFKDAFQPRLGFSYDLFADQRHVIFGGAGRAYDRNLYDHLQLEQTKFALSQAEVRFNTADHPCDVNGINCVEFDPAFLDGVENLQALLSGVAGEVNLINNDLDVPYSDQFSLGMRNRVGEWLTSVTLARVETKNGFVFTLGNRYPDGDFWENRSQPWTLGPTGIAGSMLIGNSGIESVTNQLLLSAEKPFSQESRWGTTISYTFTDAEQNSDIFNNARYAFDQVHIDEYPFTISNAVPKHRLVATGTMSIPWGMRVAAKLTLASPIPHLATSCLSAPAVFDNGAPCTAIAYAASDTIGYQSLDLQLTKEFEFGDLGSMYVRLDAINVTNHENFIDYIDVTGSDGLITGGGYNRTGNITSVPRTARVTFGVRF